MKKPAPEPKPNPDRPLFGAGRRIPIPVQLRSEALVALSEMAAARGLSRSRLVEGLIEAEAARVGQPTEYTAARGFTPPTKDVCAAVAFFHSPRRKTDA